MGGSNKETTNQVTTRAPSIGGSQLQGILGNVGNISPNLTGTQTGAIDSLVNRAGQGNQFSPGIANNANYLLGGGPQSLQDTIGGKFLDPNSNPFFSATTDAVANKTRDLTNAQYAGSGRDPAGAGSYGGQMGDNISRALAPYFLQAYQGERNNQMQGYGIDAANRQAGIGAADASLRADTWGQYKQLEAESMRTGIPLGILAQQAGIVTPAANAFATTNTTGTGEKETNPWQTAVGAGVGGVGLLGATGGFGQQGWLTGLFR